jgi:hypothetical protein
VLISRFDVTNKDEEFSLNDLGTHGTNAQDRYKEVPFLNIVQLEKKVTEIGKFLLTKQKGIQ